MKKEMGRKNMPNEIVSGKIPGGEKMSGQLHRSL
jgi:hypothetical protein